MKTLLILKSTLISRIAIAILLVLGFALSGQAQEPDLQNIPLRQTKLLSEVKHNDFKRAIFNFELGVRGDSISPDPQNNYHIRYGGYVSNGDGDWFQVSIGHGSSTQLIDLGKLNWADVRSIPFIYVSSVPHSGGWTFSYATGKEVITPENALLKIAVGHLYVIHVKDENTDLYAMFRVESLKSNDECVISWRIVPSPEPK